MANTKNDRKKRLSKTLVTIVILLIVAVVTANQAGESNRNDNVEIKAVLIYNNKAIKIKERFYVSKIRCCRAEI